MAFRYESLRYIRSVGMITKILSGRGKLLYIVGQKISQSTKPGGILVKYFSVGGGGGKKPKKK